MNRQYVGARYVPKFAEPVEWVENTSYEALTICTYNNSSYTSKIPVPANIGNPAENTKYWARTGDYNAQVEQYRQEVKENTTKVNKLISENFVNVKDYGAKGDGSTDDSNAFLEATRHGIVYVPSGTYIIKELKELGGHFIGNNAVIQLIGTGIINSNNHTTIFENITFNCGVYNLFKGLCRYITFKNCKFTGTSVLLESGDISWCGVIDFDGCDISVPVINGRAVNHVTFSNTIIQNTEYIINALNCENCSITNCDIEHVNNLFTGNIISNGSLVNSYVEWSTIVKVSSCRNFVISGNWIYGSDNNRDLAYFTDGPGGITFLTNYITLKENNIIDKTNSIFPGCLLITTAGALKNGDASLSNTDLITDNIFYGSVMMTGGQNRTWLKNFYSQILTKHTTTVTTNNNGACNINTREPILFANCSNNGYGFPYKRNNGLYDIIASTFGIANPPTILANTEITVDYYTFDIKFIKE